VNVDIEIDLTDTTLLGLVRAAGMPASVARPDIAYAGKPEASPLRQRTRALAGELPGQHDFLAAFAGADDVRAQFAMAALVAANHLLLAEDGVAEQGVGLLEVLLGIECTPKMVLVSFPRLCQNIIPGLERRTASVVG
jgi:hypothetical protein